ncbi:MAG: hypothetical protein ACTHQM_11945 [Thermoanaerobaculia bacterium]
MRRSRSFGFVLMLLVAIGVAPGVAADCYPPYGYWLYCHARCIYNGCEVDANLPQTDYCLRVTGQPENTCAHDGYGDECCNVYTNCTGPNGLPRPCGVF